MEGVRLKFDVVSPIKGRICHDMKENSSPQRLKDPEKAKSLTGEFRGIHLV